ncbi:GLUG motif-containing protein [Pseudomonas sp. BC42]|uniref:two-partner secretion domain-containing protein n=1 Tax=Pseudomonas sp. BC42 TaxID=2933816 RepID=UPI001F1F1275|nr:GLUG motif-containing protein [Pseudomonas sp. BC42]ULT69326.1 filamentous hemagglutinin N-terminal domain-containing protein [Pseudomonas sp. BC42]
MNKVYALVWNQAQGCWSVTDEGARRRRRSGTRKGLVLMAAGLLSLGGLPAAFALPTGGTVVAGAADILPFDNGKQMSINQSTDKVIINWNDFSVNKGQAVTFNQPKTTSIALNRVIGVNGSNIQGQIKANGQVFLINPNGVVFGNNAQVNVGGLVASTHNISDDNFNAGNYKFAGTSSAEVINNGSITAADGGNVALLGRSVRNEGTIKAQKGRVALGGGSAFTVSFDGNNLLDLQVDAAAINALVSNGGLLKADGGQVLMTAKSAGSMLQTVVNNQGAIEANTLSRKAGKITLDGGDVGVVNVGGSMSANALTAIGDGGVIETKGANTKVQLAARVNTQAGNGKVGTWKISSSEVNVSPTATAGSHTVYADTLSHNLATTNVELSSKTGDVSVDGAIDWTSGNQLSVNSARDIQLNSSLKGSGGGTRVELNAAQDLKLNAAVELTGINSSLGLDYGNTYALGPNGRVTLSGSGAWFDANGDLYKVIQNAAQLQAIGANLDGLYVLGNNIAGSGVIKSIGGSNTFTGTFDGLGNTVSGFTVNTDGPYGGLFGKSSGAISNLKLASMTINGTTSNAGFGYIGGLVGLNGGSINNVSASNLRVVANSNQNNTLGGLVGVNSGGSIDRATLAGTVTGNANTLAVGGLVGENRNSIDGVGSITNSSTNVQVLGTMQISSFGGMGGLVGVNKNGTIADSSSAGSVGTGFSRYVQDPNLGGLVGYNQGGSIERASSSVSVVGFAASNIGGLVGLNNNGTVTDSSASGAVTGTGSAAAGGLVGLNKNSVLNNVKATGRVADSTGGNVGGLVGKNVQSHIHTAEATGEVLGGGSGNIGGLIGHNFAGTTEYAVARGKVTGGALSYIGGLVGYNDGDLSSVEASGNVTGGNNSFVGGLAGTNGDYVDHRIDTASAKGNVVGGSQSSVGGLVGQNDSRITNSLANGQVSGGTYARLGGLVGLNMGDVRQSVAYGNISVLPRGYQTYGGLAGVNYGTLAYNTALGLATQVPQVGLNQGVIRD